MTDEEIRAERAVNGARIAALADLVAPKEAIVAAAWDKYINKTLASEDLDLYLARVREFNAWFEQEVIDAIADSTPNSRGTMRQAFAPRDNFQIWFNLSAGDLAPWLLDVAKYGSFNEHYIKAQKGLEKAGAS